MTIEKTSDLLISQAVRLEASDISIIPRRTDYLIQFRLHGSLTPFKRLPPITGERLISHLKFMASMDIGEKRKPQSGSLQTRISGKAIALRISTLPTVLSKESLVIRLLPQNETISLKQMTLFPTSALSLTSLMVRAHGMIIFSGPTGSGKTTTMYSLAEYCSTTLKRNVITLEDPVEQQHDSLLQVQVNEKAGITYSTGLKAILRHDPDIILVGEIRDAETAKIAIRAAMTGHLVLSSLHTRDAKGAIYRLLEFGVKQIDIEQTLIGVTAQRLVSLICPFCGSICSKFCARMQLPKRVGIYEILDGTALQKAMKEANGWAGTNDYQTIKDLIRKGIALGYISNEEYDRWIIEERKETKNKRTRNISEPN